ncbi:MAG TPA: VWA domain-containing protein [Pyrinomonadaceae bacterium]|nr:VWA domain-containing protein [Chloracidobacterium sp.]MBP9108103.1 VWA domain-containing protein [Pyrinomonadaceae bacterium]MBK7802081.1 VWA domain-containing protein [Chloracidobacterium sp.]MBL0239629.1 VWA domain-containing protein [Chloracidobacterium sp.]HQY68226.1 VWA domain-containing protein [Pyrinomonadaceae bacterium]
MKILISTLLLLVTAAFVSAQSGRNKPNETPTPTPATRSATGYIPTEAKLPTSLPTPTPKPKDDPDIITVDSALVPIPVSVTDASGRSVTNLKLADFELQIDGKPAEISELTRSDSPIRLAMIFDNSSSVMIAREFEKEAAVRFFKRVIRPGGDQAALFSLSDYTRLEQPLTRDVSLLTQAIRMFPEPKGATALLDGIVKVAEYLKAAEGRRVVVIVSDGEDTYSDIKTTLESVIKELQIANCQVYVVKTKEFENFKRTGLRGGNANIRSLTAERRMLELAAQTGGAVYSPIDEDEMNAAFSQISAELSQQYILSYYPDDDGKNTSDLRLISLSIKGKPNFTVRTRKGYYVGKRP